MSIPWDQQQVVRLPTVTLVTGTHKHTLAGSLSLGVTQAEGFPAAFSVLQGLSLLALLSLGKQDVRRPVTVIHHPSIHLYVV